jgi:hypothetical protein
MKGSRHWAVGSKRQRAEGKNLVAATETKELNNL